MFKLLPDFIPIANIGVKTEHSLRWINSNPANLLPTKPSIFAFFFAPLRETKTVNKMLKQLPISLLLISAALAISPKAEAREMSPANMLAETTSPAVVRIEVGCQAQAYSKTTGKTQELSAGGSGSGFFINPSGYIVSNAHVIEMIQKEAECKQYLLSNLPEHGKANDKDEYQLRSFQPVQMVVLQNGDKLPFKIITSGASVTEGGKDVAIIKVDIKNAPVLKLADSEQVKNLDKAIAFGYPGIVDPNNMDALDEASRNVPTITEGSVSAKKIMKDGSPVIQINTVTSNGSSGGPVINEQGEVIGITTFGPYGRDNFTFIVPSNTIKQFMQTAAVTNRESLTNSRYRDALSLYSQGKYSEALQKFQQVKQLFPQHSEVDRLMQYCHQMLGQFVQK